MQLSNYHSHCTFCDGRSTPEDFVKFAVSHGFRAYGFSSHSPLPFETFWNMSKLRGRDDARGRAPAAGARSKGESGKAKRDKRDFFHKVFRSGTTTNRDEPAKPEEGGASRGRSRKGAAGEQPAKVLFRFQSRLYR